MNFEGYKWIKVKQFKFDPNKSWEENYKELERHHIEETTFLINKVREIAGKQNPISNYSYEDIRRTKPE